MRGPANDFKILGPLAISVHGTARAVDSGKLRILLTALLLHAGSVVPTWRLTEWMWDEQQPANPKAALHTCVRRLRKALDDGELVATTGTGYRIDVDAGELDLLRFRELVRSAGDAGDAAERVRRLAEAIALWRGQALADIPSESLRQEFLTGLDEEYLGALESRFDAELGIGRHGALVKEIRAAAIDNPYRERFWRMLMLALYRAGRQSEALEVYQQVRDKLVDELGIEPGDELRALHKGILTADPKLAAPNEIEPDSQTVGAAPAQLPPDAVGFVGRTEHFARLGDLLRSEVTSGETPVVLVSGQPGVGKTAFAVRLGRRVRDAFPDGQLYVNLCGHEGPGQDAPLSPEQVLPQFLRSLGVPAKQVPFDVVEQGNLYRSKLAEANLLMVLDNAASVEQVLPLIPGGGCAVLITSRYQLRSLVASHGAQVISLGTLAPAESRELVQGMLERAEITADPGVASEVARLCAHLPLALRIAAANLIKAPGGQLDEYVDALRANNRLAALSVEGDTTLAVSTAIALSYDRIAPDDQRLFRLAGMFPGAEFAPDAVAVLADVSTAQATSALSRLEAANLLQQHAPGRYRYHSLLREYAGERLDAESSSTERADARERLGAWYLTGARNAADVLYPDFVRLRPGPGMRPAGSAPKFAEESRAVAWLLAEWRNLLGCIRHFGAAGPGALAWYLADALRAFFWTRNYPSEWREAARTGLAAAETAADTYGIASMHRSLANLYNTVGQYQQAIAHHRHSLAAHHQLDMPEEAAATLNNLSLTHLSLGQVADAESAGLEALEIAERVASPRIEAATLGLLGSIKWICGDLRGATAAITESVTKADDLGLPHISAYSLRNLGLLRRETGEPEQARACFTRALAVSERIGSSYDKSIALYGLALLEHDSGEHQVALESAREALAAFGECGDRTYEVETLCALSVITEALGDWEESARYAALAFEGARRIDYLDGQAYATARMSVTERALGRESSALKHAEAALRMADDSVNRITRAKVRSELA